MREKDIWRVLENFWNRKCSTKQGIFLVGYFLSERSGTETTVVSFNMDNVFALTQQVFIQIWNTNDRTFEILKFYIENLRGVSSADVAVYRHLV